ncbi:MAG: HAMP domain-containing sensor histidine kinase, partial [Chloroflexota bacterium]|nr:HAMP domain-containing sensor histidine kinase [Chloroflexota bacterium]
MKSLSIRTKFILAFLVVSLLAILLVGAFTSYVSNRQFKTMVLDRFKKEYTTTVVKYYETTGTLLGIQFLFRPNPDNHATDPENFVHTGMVLALPNGGILVGDEKHPTGSFLSADEIKAATKITYEGKTIAYLVTNNPPIVPNLQETLFIERTNKAMLYASLVAVVVAVVTGLLFTRTLLQPLSGLSAAISKMEQGELEQEVPNTSNDELGKVIEGFNQMSTALTAANARRDQMTADIAHELRSPLTVINGYLEAMQDGSLDATAERLSFIQEEVNQLNRLVSDLRTLAMADAGELEIQKDNLVIRDLLSHLNDAYRLQAVSKQINLSFVIEPEDLTIYADEGRINQILSNLLNNALRHTPPGGSITVNAAVETGNPVITVSDTGEGIPATDLPLLFDRFYRADPSRQASEGESGLGLSIVKALVEAHDGEITVSSRMGSGTIF